MRNALHILLVSNSSARRSRLAEVLRKSLERATVKVAAGLGMSQWSLEQTAADVLIADLDGPSAAADFIRLLKDLSGRIGAVVLIDDPEPQWVRAALGAGIHAIISHNPDADELQLAVAAAEAGLVLLHPISASNLIARDLRSSLPAAALEPLTARECQVLRLMSEGLGNKEIAARLEISEHTAKFHISSILGKLGAASRTEAVSTGIRNGLIPI
jgi:NarL family two-component system response regulator YdfI